MLKTAETQLLENRWSDADAAGKSESELLLYRSNILGSDKRVTNYGGGNTSAKVMETDPLTGDQAEVLWVKGSGGDVGSIKMDGFATLYMDKLNALRGVYRGVEFEDERVGFLPIVTAPPRMAERSAHVPAQSPRHHPETRRASRAKAVPTWRNEWRCARHPLSRALALEGFETGLSSGGASRSPDRPWPAASRYPRRPVPAPAPHRHHRPAP